MHKSICLRGETARVSKIDKNKSAQLRAGRGYPPHVPHDDNISACGIYKFVHFLPRWYHLHSSCEYRCALVESPLLHVQLVCCVDISQSLGIFMRVAVDMDMPT